jgi:hypothetical protein
LEIQVEQGPQDPTCYLHLMTKILLVPVEHIY